MITAARRIEDFIKKDKISKTISFLLHWLSPNRPFSHPHPVQPAGGIRVDLCSRKLGGLALLR